MDIKTIINNEMYTSGETKPDLCLMWFVAWTGAELRSRREEF